MSVKKILDIARGEVGYLEKKTNKYLDEKTANAGYNNYTKYGQWYGMNGEPWCDMFVSWCAERAGEASSVGHFAYVPYHTTYFRNKGQYFAKGSKTPRPGDIIIFRNESHIGLVEYVENGYVHTIEGNTSSGSTLISNGGGVHQKKYPLSSLYIQGYGRPNYTVDEPEEEDEEMLTYEQFCEYMKKYRKELQDNDSHNWSEADRKWAVDVGIIAGSGTASDGSLNYMWEDFLTREQAVTFMHRLAKYIDQLDEPTE